MRNLILGFNLFFLLPLLASQGLAFVNLSNGEFTAQAVDLQFNEGSHQFKLYRFYNHKVEVQGMFGHHWCANIEQELRETADGYVSYACGEATQMLFKENKKITLKKGEKAYSWEQETLIKLGDKNKGFIRYSPTSGVSTYNSEGLLIGMREAGANSPWVRLIYNKGKLITKIIFGSKISVSLKYDDHKQLIGITGPKKLTVRYRYSKNHTLVYAKNLWKHIYKYSYDEKQRLTQISYPDKSFDSITYDTKTNVVVKTTDRNTCQSTYTRKVIPNSQQLQVQVASDCAAKPKNFIFSQSTLFAKNRKTIAALNLLKKTHDESRVPASLPYKVSEKKVQELFASDFQYKFGVNADGQPTAVIETEKKSNKKTSLVLSYEKGLLKSLSSPTFGSIHYEYNKDALLVRSYANPLRPRSELVLLDTYERFITQFNKRKAASW